MKGFRLPAEWEPHAATWIGWPHQKEDWPGKITPILWVYAEIVRYLARGEKVRIIVQSKEHQQRALKHLKAVEADLKQIEFFIKKTDRSWLRDSGPAFVKNEKEVALVDFNFNAWAKYKNYKNDRQIPQMISERLKVKRFAAPITLEGGSIDINGKGTLITTEECLMDPKVQVRNKGYTKKDYEKVFKEYLGITSTIWLGKGIAGDDTHGHVDDLCRFVNKDTVVIVKEENERDVNFTPLQENIERLKSYRALKTIFLPMPSPVVFKGIRLPASYANFYISNTHVLVPTFNDPKDYKALGIIADLFPDRVVTGIHAVDLVWGLGTIHCLTHEQPAL
jgi:agmatine deiminase